jgi:hypothetical protein
MSEHPGRWALPALAGGVVVVLAAGLAALRTRPQEAPKPAFAAHVRPFLDAYCASCHGPQKAKAKLDFSKFPDEAAVLADRKLWKRVWDQVQAFEMPPEDAKAQPKPDERERFALAVEALLDREEPGAPRDPGRVVIRRLNRVEYRNTIRDLVGVAFDPTADFPSDDVGYGFDNIGDVLSLPPLLMEKYLAAAERILDQAVFTEDRRKPAVRRLEAEQMQVQGGASPDGFQQVLFANGEVFTTVEVPQDGQYLLRIRAGEDRAGTEPAKMTVRVDDREVKTIDVNAPRDRLKVFEEKTPIRAGRRRIGAAFINDFYDPQAKDRFARDRNLVIDYVELVGPVDAKPAEPPPSHARIFFVKPGVSLTKREAASQILARFAERAWRRPLRPGEVERLLTRFDLAERNGESFEVAVRVPLLAVLVSPHFLFRVEPDPPGTDPKGVSRVDGHALASRLSYFLWSSMPDDELLGLARDGKLAEPAVLDAQVGRMLRDPRARSLAENFAVQWLQLRRLETHVADPKRFPAFDEKLREAFRREVELLFDEVVREDRNVLTLLDADFTYLNERLARHYGIEGVRGEEMRRVELQDPRRGGVLMMGGILTVTSNPTRTSPVKRGKWVLETILGTPPPPPLPDAGELKDEPEGAEKLTVRQLLEAHRADPSCANCHRRMDPIGIAFENYDGIGRWRETEGRLPLDVGGTLADGKAFQGPVELKRILLGRKDDFARNLVERMLTYALGRGVEYYDGPAIKEMRKSLAGQGYRMSALVAGIARSYPFQHRRNRAGGASHE